MVRRLVVAVKGTRMGFGGTYEEHHVAVDGEDDSDSWRFE